MIKLFTVQRINFFINEFFKKCDEIRSFLWIWSHLLKKSFMENFIFCTVIDDKICTINVIFLHKKDI